jgi:hypothetical protein
MELQVGLLETLVMVRNEYSTSQKGVMVEGIAFFLMTMDRKSPRSHLILVGYSE